MITPLNIHYHKCNPETENSLETSHALMDHSINSQVKETLPSAKDIQLLIQRNRKQIGFDLNSNKHAIHPNPLDPPIIKPITNQHPIQKPSIAKVEKYVEANPFFMHDIEKYSMHSLLPIKIEDKTTHSLVTYSDGSKSIHHILFTHLSTILLVELSEYVCKQCGESRTNKHSFQRHLFSHAEPTPCPYCGKLLKSSGRPDVLKRHFSVCKSYKS